MPQPLVSGAFVPAAPFQNADYNTLIPRAIEYAELKMYRDTDLNLLYTRKTDSLTNFTIGQRTVAVPGSIIIPEQVAAITPAGSTIANGTRVQFHPVSLDFINQAWPQAGVTYTPSVDGPGPWWCLLDPSTIVVAPTPPAAYVMEVTGVYRPAALAQTANATTYLTLNLPDLFTAASMIFWTGAMKDYGAQSDDPRMAISWTTVYDDLKKGAAVESARQRSQGPGWAAYTPTTVAIPSRS